MKGLRARPLGWAFTLVFAALPFCATTSIQKEEPATVGWMYGKWAIDRRASLQRMLQERGLSLDSLPADQQQQMLRDFDLNLTLDLSPSGWSGTFSEGQRDHPGHGTYEIESGFDGVSLIMNMREVLSDGTAKTNRLGIHRIDQNRMRLQFLDQDGDYSIIMNRQ